MNVRKTTTDTEMKQLMQLIQSGKVSTAGMNGTVAYVSAAVDLTTDEQTRLQKALSNLLGQTVEVQVQQDASLLGGVRIEVGDWVIDTSMKAQIDKMVTSLKG